MDVGIIPVTIAIFVVEVRLSPLQLSDPRLPRCDGHLHLPDLLRLLGLRHIRHQPNRHGHRLEVVLPTQLLPRQEALERRHTLDDAWRPPGAVLAQDVLQTPRTSCPRPPHHQGCRRFRCETIFSTSSIVSNAAGHVDLTALLKECTKASQMSRLTAEVPDPHHLRVDLSPRFVITSTSGSTFVLHRLLVLVPIPPNAVPPQQSVRPTP